MRDFINSRGFVILTEDGFIQFLDIETGIGGSIDIMWVSKANDLFSWSCF